MNKNFFVFSLLAITFLSLGLVAANPITLFEDDFETGSLSKWTIIDSPSITNDSSYVNGGTYAVLFNGGPDPDDQIISLAIDTTGYKDIDLEYSRLIESLESDNGFVAEYSTNGGSSWTTLEDVYGDESYTDKSFSLSAAAEDNSDLKIRFFIYAGATSADYAALDDVLVTGDDLDAPEISDIGHTPMHPVCTDDVRICFNVTDLSLIDTITLKVFWDGDWQNWPVPNFAGDTYCKDLSASTYPLSYPPTSNEDSADGQDLSFDVYVEDEHGNSQMTEGGGSFTYDCADPVADANGPYTCNEGSYATLDASASTDTVDNNLDYYWDFDDDGNYDDATGVTPTFDCIEGPSVHNISVKAVDDAGHEDTSDSMVTVSNLAPKVSAGGPYTVDEGDYVIMYSTVSDPGVLDTHTYNWTLDSAPDTGAWINGPAQADAEFRCVEDGTYFVTLTVTDDDGASTADGATITCDNLAPNVAAGSDQTVNEGDQVTIAPTWSDPGVQDTHTYMVDWGDSTVDSLFTHTYCNDGGYSVSVDVTDDEGDTGSDTLTVNVNNVLPTFDNLPSNAMGVDGSSFSFDVDASDVGCDTLTYSITNGAPFGMTINSGTGEIYWSSAVSGDYIVTIAVDDGTGSVEANLTIHIYDYEIDFGEGWNCFSIPLVPEDDDVSIDNVLGQDVRDVAEKIWSYTYDGSTGKNVWRYGHPIVDKSRWSAANGRVQEIVPGYGYYLFTDDGVVSYQDGKRMYGGDNSPPYRPSVTLNHGDNLIGHYYMNLVPKHMELNDLTGNDNMVDNHLATQALFDEEGYNARMLYPTECYWASIAGQNPVDYWPSPADSAIPN